MLLQALELPTTGNVSPYWDIKVVRLRKYTSSCALLHRTVALPQQCAFRAACAGDYGLAFLEISVILFHAFHVVREIQQVSLARPRPCGFRPHACRHRRSVWNGASTSVQSTT